MDEPRTKRNVKLTSSNEATDRLGLSRIMINDQLRAFGTGLFNAG